MSKYSQKFIKRFGSDYGTASRTVMVMIEMMMMMVSLDVIMILDNA